MSELREIKDSKVLEFRDSKVSWGHKASKVYRVLWELRVLKDSSEHRDFRELALRGSRAIRVFLRLAHRAIRAISDYRDRYLLVLRVVREFKVYPVDRRAIRVLWEVREL